MVSGRGFGVFIILQLGYFLGTMAKPNSEQFARVVLWHLAGLRAEMAELHARLARMEAEPLSGEELKKWQDRTNQLRDKTFLEALKVAEIEPPPSDSTDFQRN